MHLICCTYPATSANFNTNYVIFKKVESFLKNYKRKKYNSRKIWNCHECFICENENSKLINYSTNMCRSCHSTTVFSHWPHGIRKYYPTCCKRRNLKHEVKFQGRFLRNFSNSFDPKMSTFIEQAPTYMPHDFLMQETN
jgi:hypothetical protein